jgi:hypothetical protein
MGRMKPLRIRRLTEGERALAAEMFGSGLDACRVRLLALPAWSRAFVAGPRLMVWPAADAVEDFSTAPLPAQAVFVHELTHVWQAQNGISLLLAKIKAGDSHASYDYRLDGADDFAALNIEQQAMVVQHAFEVSRGGRAPYPAELYARAGAHWRRS